MEEDEWDTEQWGIQCEEEVRSQEVINSSKFIEYSEDRDDNSWNNQDVCVEEDFRCHVKPSSSTQSRIPSSCETNCDENMDTMDHHEELSLLIKDLQNERSLLIAVLNHGNTPGNLGISNVNTCSLPAGQTSSIINYLQDHLRLFSTTLLPPEIPGDPESTTPISSFDLQNGQLPVHFSCSSRLKQIESELSKLLQLQEIQQTDRSHKRSQMGKMMTNAVTSTAPNDGPCNTKLLPGEYQHHHHQPEVAPSANQQHRPEPQNSMFQFFSMMNGDHKATTERLLTLCQSKETCLQLSCMGIMPFIVQIIHDPNCGISRTPREIRVKAGTILHRLVSSHPEDKRTRREMSVLKLLEEIRNYSDQIINRQNDLNLSMDNLDDRSPDSVPPVQFLIQLMKKSYEEEFRHSICLLGGLQAVAELLQCNFSKYDHTNSRYHSEIRINAAKILVNLTFGDGTNKSLLSSSPSFLETLSHMVGSGSDDVRMNVASLIRNLSWKTDIASRENLRNAKMISPLLRSAMMAKSEMSLKAMLSALWNISAHWIENKQEICSTDGALEFLISHLSQKRAFSTTSVVELSGGILRNICSVIADREDYRNILRQNHCLEVLVSHLRAPSIEWVINATGILWNLSSRCAEDQKKLWDLGAVSLLKGLMNNKDGRIAANSGHAYRKLMSAQTNGRAQSMPRRWKNGRNVNANISLDDGRQSDTTTFRKMSSVPNSPLVFTRSNRSNVDSGSKSDRHRRPSNNSDHRRDQMTLLMNETRREIKESFTIPPIQPKNVSSPPLSESSSSGEEETSFPVGNNASNNSKFVYPVHAPVQENCFGYAVNLEDEPYFQTIPTIAQSRNDPPRYSPYRAPFGNNFSLQWKIKSNEQSQDEAETRDEFTDYGLTNGVRNFVLDPLEDAEDTIRQFNTEGTPLFSTATSIYDLRSGSFSKKPILNRNGAIRTTDVTGLVAVPVKHVTIDEVNINSMMVSRSSSPGNLSEVDLVFNDENENEKDDKSVYSMRVSGAVSPSDIPASPSLMPRSQSNTKNKRRILPVPPVGKKAEESKVAHPVRIRDVDLSEDEQNILADCINSGMSVKMTSSIQDKSSDQTHHSQPLFSPLQKVQKLAPAGDNIPDDMFVPDSTRTFASEGISAATSLSSLTLSGICERPKIRPKLLPKLPFPEEAEEDTPPQSNPLQNGSTNYLTDLRHPSDQYSPKSQKSSAPCAFWVDAANGEQLDCLTSFVEKKSIGSSPLSPSGIQKSSADLMEAVELKPQNPNQQTNNASFGNSPLSPATGPPTPIRASSTLTRHTISDHHSVPNGISNNSGSGSPSEQTAPPPPPPLQFHLNTHSPLKVRTPKSLSTDQLATPPPLPPPLNINLLKSPKRSPAKKSLEGIHLTPCEGETEVPPLPNSDPPPLSPEAQYLIDKLDQDLLADCIYAALPKKSKERKKSASSEKTEVQPDINDEDLLADCIYAALPVKPKRPSSATKKISQSARRTQIQMSIKEMTLSHSFAGNVVDETGGKSAVIRKSRTFEETGLEEQKKEMKTHSLPRDHLKLSLLRKAVPDFGDRINDQHQGDDRNSGKVSQQSDASPSLKLSEVSPPVLLNSSSMRHMDSPMSSSHTLTDAIPNHSITRNTSSPDIFEGLNEVDSSLASRFTSEASGEEDDMSGKGAQIRRPKIIKPVRNAPNGVKKTGNGDVVGNGKIGGSIRNGRTSIPVVPVNRPVNGRADSVPLIQTEAAVEQTYTNGLPKLIKQGTFIKSGHSAMLPVIFPDSDISKNASTRKRFTSVTRIPREGSSSRESQSITKAPSPNFRSSRSLSARPPEKLSVDLCAAPKPKKKPVVSKIAALLKSDKSKVKPEKEKEDVPFFSSWRKSSDASGVKSPTLSEKFSSRHAITVPQRMNATLPKNMSVQSAVLNNKNSKANSVEKSQAQSKGSVTVTSV